MDFTAENISRLFGNEAAEDEQVSALQNYYYKGQLYKQIKSDNPLYIIVAHKGAGKSALLRVCSSEETSAGNISIELNYQDTMYNNKSLSLQELTITAKQELCKSIFKYLIERIMDMNAKHRTKELGEWITAFSGVLKNTVGTSYGEIKRSIPNITETVFYRIFSNEVFKTKKVTVYIDDLDLGWNNDQNNIKTISAIIGAVREIIRKCNNQLHFRIALRSSVYYSVRTSDESTDKFESAVVWLSWTNDEIYRMLVKRVLAYENKTIDDAKLNNVHQKALTKYITNVFDPVFRGKGKWENAPIHRIMMSLIRKRPRDLIKLCLLAAHAAELNQHNKILTSDFQEVFSEYSQGRLQDTVNEYKTELDNIEEVLLKFKPSQREAGKSIYKQDELSKKLDGIIGQLSNTTFSNHAVLDSRSLRVFLYKINFMTARKELPDGTIQRLYFEDHKYVINEYADFGYDMEIHPAYRWALQPSMRDNYYNLIYLSD